MRAGHLFLLGAAPESRASTVAATDIGGSCRGSDVASISDAHRAISAYVPFGPRTSMTMPRQRRSASVALILRANPAGASPCTPRSARARYGKYSSVTGSTATLRASIKTASARGRGLDVHRSEQRRAAMAAATVWSSCRAMRPLHPTHPGARSQHNRCGFSTPAGAAVRAADSGTRRTDRPDMAVSPGQAGHVEHPMEQFFVLAAFLWRRSRAGNWL